MTAVLIFNTAVSIPVFVVIVGLALWSFRSQRGDRPHILVRTRRPVRAAPARARYAGRSRAWSAH